MQNDKRGTLLMLDSSLRDLPAPASIPAPASPQPRNRTEATPGATPDTPQAPKGGKDAGKKGHKKQKQAKHLAEVKAELTGLSEALRQLRGRVSDLHALQLEREGQGAGLATRLDALGAEQARGRGLTAALDERIEALRTKVDALRAEAAVITDTLADLAVQPDRDTALFALEDRIQEVEESLAGLRALAGQGEGLTERLDLLGRDLASQTDRLAGLEGRVAPEEADTLAGGRLEQSLGALGTSLDERILGMERDLATLRDQNKRWREAERVWAEERLSGLRRGLAGGVALVALLLLTGFVATWWHGERQLDLIAARIAAVEQGTGERLAGLAAPSTAADDRLAISLDRLGAAMQGVQATSAELSARIAARPAPAPASGEATMTDLLARLRALEESRSAGSAPDQGPGADAMPQMQTEPQPAPQDQAAADRSPVDASGPVSSAPREQDAMPGLDATEGPKAEASPIAEPAPGGAPTQAPAAVQGGLDGAAMPSVNPPEAIGAPAVQRYALQLIGFRTQTSIAPFARQHGIFEDVRWLRTPGRGRDWYLVLLGDYGSREEAKAALADLSAGLRGLSPVVRPLPAEAQPMAAD